MVDDDTNAMDDAVSCPICEDRPGHFDDAGSVEVRCPNNCTELTGLGKTVEDAAYAWTLAVADFERRVDAMVHHDDRDRFDRDEYELARWRERRLGR